MGVHLLHGLSQQLTHLTVFDSDSQAVIRALGNQCTHSGQYILDAIHQATECLHAKQDGIINKAEHLQIMNAREQWKDRKKGGN